MWTDAFRGENALLTDCIICINDVINAHFSVVDYFLENGEGTKDSWGLGPIDKTSLSSAVSMQRSECMTNQLWQTDDEKCSALFYGLIRNRPFRVCNKRTALLTALYYLRKLNRKTMSHHKEIEILTKIIESNTIRDRKAFKPYSKFEDGEIRFLAQYFQKNTCPVEEKSYVTTYNELNRNLRDFGFCLDNPHGNSIDVVRIEKRASLLGFSTKRERRSKAGEIGFPGWTREVSQKDMNHIYKCTGLGASDGLDRRVPYLEAPPLSSLINEYRDVLEQLPPRKNADRVRADDPAVGSRLPVR